MELDQGLRMEAPLDHLLAGQLYCRLLEYEKAQAVLCQGLALVQAQGNFLEQAELLLFCAHFFHDTGQIESLQSLLRQLEDYRAHVVFRSGLSYIEGIQAAEKGDFEEAQRLFEIAESTATSVKEEMQAAYGLCLISYFRGHWRDLLNQLSVLEERLILKPSPEVEFAVCTSKARALLQLGFQDLALETIHKMRDLANLRKSLVGHIQSLISEAFLLLDMKEYLRAKEVWGLIVRLSPPDTSFFFKKRLSALREEIEKLDSVPVLILRSEENRILLFYREQSVELTKITQLKNLLVHFAIQKGKSLTKEDICNFVWGEPYHPLRHDNKIYVTIRRLRALLGELGLTDILLNCEDGYLFNPKIRFLSEEASSARAKGLNYIPKSSRARTTASEAL